MKGDSKDMLQISNISISNKYKKKTKNIYSSKNPEKKKTFPQKY